MAYDLLIRNGLVIDGTGTPGQRADIAVAGGKIVEIGRFNGSARQTIDASDCVVLPAFIDSQSVGSLNRGERRYDLPGGGKRMVMPSRGIRYTIVNGVMTYAEGELVGASAGQVLRS